MSLTPPPGWYPDPEAPSTERWWDGAAWTPARRQPMAAPPVPPPPSAPGPGGGDGRGRIVALAAAGVALVAAIVAGAVVVLTGGGGDGPEARDGTTGAGTGSPPASTTVRTSAPPPTEDPTRVTDQLNGITLPVIDGWRKAQYVADHDVLLTTPDSYTCPYDDGVCWPGTVATHTVTGEGGSDPKALAAQDVSDAADLVYDTTAAGDRPFGGITGHQVVAERQLAVGGRAGYLVRWKVTTAEGPGGYVQSVVFPSSVGSESLVAVRGTLDAGADAPPLTDLDRIVKGIRPVGGTGGGGVGSSLGPDD